MQKYWKCKYLWTSSKYSMCIVIMSEYGYLYKNYEIPGQVLMGSVDHIMKKKIFCKQ